MRRIVLTFGLIAGVLLSLMMLATVPFMDRIGFDHGLVIGYTTMVLAFLLVYFGIRSYRDTVGGGRIGFGRAVAIGLLITAIASACYVATWEVVYFNFMPDFADKYAAHELDRMRRSGATAEAIESKTREMAEFKAMYRNPLINVSYTFLEPLPVGVVMTLVSAGMLSRRRRAPDGGGAAVLDEARAAS